MNNGIFVLQMNNILFVYSKWTHNLMTCVHERWDFCCHKSMIFCLYIPGGWGISGVHEQLDSYCHKSVIYFICIFQVDEESKVFMNNGILIVTNSNIYLYIPGGWGISGVHERWDFVFTNLWYFVCIFQVDEESQVFRTTQGEQDQYEMHVRAANMVRHFTLDYKCSKIELDDNKCVQCSIIIIFSLNDNDENNYINDNNINNDDDNDNDNKNNSISNNNNNYYN